IICHLELAKQCAGNGRYEEALQLLGQAENYPSNLGEGKLAGAQENDIHYWKGIMYEKLGNKETAEQYYHMAARGISEPVPAVFYNDPQPDKIFYQGLAWIKLNKPQKAAAIFRRLINFGQAHIRDNISIDYFAVSLPGLSVFDANLNALNKVHCYYIMGLGYLGLGKEHTEKAAFCFEQALQSDRNHQGVLLHAKSSKTNRVS
ncbi:MAG TPA: tetratricopeptide repeat protein, partial [Agriterribacter sp.]|nr:tetratricopeptide repeat protein [Agriterribacter sp.]